MRLVLGVVVLAFCITLSVFGQSFTITTIAGTGAPGFIGDNGPANDAQLKLPGGVAVDSAGNIYIADTSNCRIRKVSQGVITTVAGNGTAGFSGDNGPAISAQLNCPYGIAIDRATFISRIPITIEFARYRMALLQLLRATA